MKRKIPFWQRLIPIISMILLGTVGLFMPVGPQISADDNFVSFTLNTAQAVQIPVQAQPQKRVFAPSTSTNSPNSTSGSWTNPTNAYTDGGGYADIVSGSPSASENYSGFGWLLYGTTINQVRVRTDAYCAGIASSKIVYPSSDYATATGTWAVYPTSPTTYWDKVDDVTADNDSTYLTHGTSAGYRMFGFTSPNLNSNVTIQNVTISITARDASSGTNKIQPALRIGGTNYLTTSTSTEVPTSYGVVYYAYTTNPKTSANWTVADVNGTGTNPLQYFGTNSADASPSIRITKVTMTVNYTTGTDEQLNLYTSWDSGVTWSSAHTTNLTSAEKTYWTDVTSDIKWDYIGLLDKNLIVRVEAITVGETSDVRLDYISTEVTSTTVGGVTQTATNQYTIGTNADSIQVGNTSGSFVPVFTLPRWEGTDWATSIGLTLGVAANALASTFTSSSISTGANSVTASNNYMTLVYSGTETNNGFNENGGMDLNITLKQNIGNTIAFGYDSTNVNAYLQPSLTKEWTVGQDLGDGRTVASVTDTDVTDNLGNNVCHRPDYVVNSIAFYSSTGGGMVSTAQAATGYTTGQIGMLYRMNLTGANGVTGYGDWSVVGSNFILTLNNISNMTYPVSVAPAGDTFGYQTKGATTLSAGGSYITGGQYTGGVGTGTSITAYITGSGGITYIYAIYDNSSPSNPISNGTTVSGTLPGPSGNAWFTLNFTNSPTLSASNYNLQGWASASVAMYGTSAGSGKRKSDATGYPIWPTNVTWSSLNYQVSIYCTYTAGGGATAPTVVTGAASSILDTKVTCAENVTATGGANVTAWGTYYGTTTSYGSNVTNTGSNNVSFGWTDALSSLSANTTYYYKAFATNSAGSANGTSANFTTGYVTYSANQTTYSFGVVAPSSTTNTSGTWLLFTNTSSISTNISVKMLASTWTSTGTGWTHSDSAAGANTVAMKANSSNATTWATSVFITYNAPYSAIATNVAANSNVVTGLSLLAPTSFTDGKSDNNTIRFTFFSSS